MSNLAYDDSAASELIGYVYTIAVSILILSSIMLTSTTMLNGNIANTAQEEAEQLALAAPKAKSYLQGRQIRKVIVVPERLVKIVCG